MIWVIIPAYNEQVALPATLLHLFRQTGNYRALVVDGGSTDKTCELAIAHPSVTLLRAPKGRASQMNAGARHAIREGGTPNDWLLFLHADTILPDGAIQRLNQMESDLTNQAGGFRHRFTGTDWRLRLISWLDNARCRMSRIVYGDQALFVRQGLFERLGGFPHQPMLEDIAFGEKLLTQVKPILLSPPVITDARKFIQMGIWRSLARVLMIILCVEFRLHRLPKTFSLIFGEYFRRFG